MGTATARAEQHIRERHIDRHLFEGTLAGKAHHLLNTSPFSELAQLGNLGRFASNDEIASCWKVLRDDCGTTQKQIDPLIAFQRAGVEQHWGISDFPAAA